MRQLIIALTVAVLGSQTLKRFEIRRPTGSSTGKLVAYVENREVHLSTDVLEAWEGWHPEVVLFTEKLPSGKEKLRAFNAITGERSTITTETASIEDITSVLLDNNQHTLVLFLRGPADGTPSLALASPKTGVFRRINNAKATAIVNDTVIVHRFNQDVNQRGGGNPVTFQRPRTEVISLRPASQSAP